MRILLIASAYPPHVKGGGELSTQFLAEGLHSHGHEVHVLTISNKAAYEVKNGIYVERIKSPNIYWNYKDKAPQWKNFIWHMLENWNPIARIVIKKRIKLLKPDLVLTSTTENFGCNAWAVAHSFGIPSVHVLRSYNNMCTQAIMYKNNKNCDQQCKKCRFLSLNKKRLSNEVKGIIGISNFILKKHISNSFFQKAKPAILTNFMPDDVLNNLPDYSQNGRPLQEKITFGYLGRISEEKGVSILTETYKKVSPNYQTKLLLAGLGDQNYVDCLKKDLCNFNVEFIGWTKQEDFFKKIDYLIVPSIWHEPLGRIVFEAFCYGIPVIGSSNGGIPDMIKHEENGFLFDINNPEQLEELLHYCSSKKEIYASLSKNAFKSREKHRASIIIKKYTDYFETLL